MLDGRAFQITIQSKQLRTGALALLSWALILAPIVKAEETTCAALAPWFEVQSRRPQPGDPTSTWARWQGEIYQSLQVSSANVYSDYRDGTLPHEFFAVCPDRLQDDRDRFRRALVTVFFERSLEELTQVGPLAAELAAQVRKHGTDALVLFRLTGHFPETPPPNDANGGFHRGSRSIFMRFMEIPREQWLLIFAHEVLHLVDEQLARAVLEWGNLPTRDWIDAEIRPKSRLSELSPADRQRLRAWLMAGLDRGLLAECRAWKSSIQLYREGRVSRRFESIGWIDAMGVHPFAFLDPRFVDPVEAPLSYPVVREALKMLREEIRQSSEPCPL